ncbi:MAG: hypothetical protein P8J45_13765 [Phycisphaerales bacterium]|nr:hypothetical protein [Phycisphaerales bacterium]
MFPKINPTGLLSTVAIGLLCPAILHAAESPLEFSVVNEPGGRGFDQTNPVLVETDSGALLGFSDERSGAPEHRIRVIDVEDGGSSRSVSLVSDAFPLRTANLVLGSNRTGDTVAAWQLTTDLDGLRISRIDSLTGERVGETATILHDEQGGSIWDVSLEVMPDGSNLIFFMSGTSCRARIYTRSFQPLGPSFLIEDNTGGNYVDTAFHEDGSFTLAWTGVNKPYFSTVRARRFNADGTPRGASHDLTTEADEVFIDTPAIAGRADGTAVVSWLKNDLVPVILGQALDVEGTPVGEPQLLVSGESIFGDPRHLYPKADGSWALVQQMEQGDWATSVQLFDHDLNATDTLLTIEDTYRNQAVWLSSSEDVFMVWESTGNQSQKTIQGSVLSTGQGTISDEMQLSDDVDGADQVAPVVDANESGRLVVAWLDFRDIVPGIYFQLYDETGDPEGANVFLAGATPESGGRLGVDINASGEIVIAWTEYASGRRDLHARRFAADSTPLGEVMAVTASDDEGMMDDYRVDILDDGRILASWNRFAFMTSEGSLKVNLHSRLYSSAGEPLTETGIRVNEITSEVRAHRPLAVSVTADDVTRLHYAYTRPNWTAVGGFVSEVSSRIIDVDGLPNEEEQHVDLTVPYIFSQVSFSALAERYAVAWTGHPDGRISCQSGTTGSDIVHLDTIISGDQLRNPNILHAPDGNCHLTYRSAGMSEGQSITDIMSRRYDAFFLPVGESMVFFSLGEEGLPSNSTAPETTLAAQRLVGTLHARSGTDQGLDVFMATVAFDPCLAADYNCDGRVDGADLGRLIGFWEQPQTDIDGDGTTDGNDLVILLGHWTG